MTTPATTPAATCTACAALPAGRLCYPCFMEPATGYKPGEREANERQAAKAFYAGNPASAPAAPAALAPALAPALVATLALIVAGHDTAKDLAAKLGVTPGTAARRARKLAALGLVHVGQVGTATRRVTLLFEVVQQAPSEPAGEAPAAAPAPAPAPCTAPAGTPAQLAQAAQLRAEGARHAQEREASFDRCDTDGFLSQWASGLSSSLAQRQAQLLEQGGTDTFLGLFHRATGSRVVARLVEQPDRFAGYGTVLVWTVLAKRGRRVDQWVPHSKGTKASKMFKLGYEIREERAPAEAFMNGQGTGLSGTAWVAVRRTDDGFPEGASYAEDLA